MASADHFFGYVLEGFHVRVKDDKRRSSSTEEIENFFLKLVRTALLDRPFPFSDQREKNLPFSSLKCLMAKNHKRPLSPSFPASVEPANYVNYDCSKFEYLSAFCPSPIRECISRCSRSLPHILAQLDHPTSACTRSIYHSPCSIISCQKHFCYLFPI